MLRSLLLLLVALCALAVHAENERFRVLRSVGDVTASVETARRVNVVLLLSSASDPKLRELSAENGETHDDNALVAALETQFPHLRRIVDGMDGAVEFIVADIADTKAVTKKWNAAQLPALVVYKDAPKKNPYTGKLYRDAALLSPAVLQQPRELKKLLRESIPSSYVTSWSSEIQITTLDDAEAWWKKADHAKPNALVVLLSKQATPSHLYRALAMEYAASGLSFAYVHNDEAIATELKNKWGIEKLPALVVVTSPQSLDEYVSQTDGAKLKTFADLKSFVEPFAQASSSSDSDSEASARSTEAMDIKDVPLLTAATFDKYVFESKLSWVVSFMDEATESSTDPQQWKTLTNEVQRKSGVVGLGGVSCKTEADLCAKYGGAGSIRVFPIVVDEATGDVTRGEVLPESFPTIDAAKQAAIDAIPDTVSVLATSGELNAFVSRALATKSMPIVLITSKMETPAVLKSLALSFATQKISVAVASAADPLVRQQFQIGPKAKSTLVCLVTVPSAPGQPENASPFGIFKYDKKTMGAMTYPNLVRFLVTVLHQHPHPREDAEAQDTTKPVEDIADESEGEVAIPYLAKANFDSLCSGNKICAIGFFDGHVDTVNDPDSPLAKSLQVLQAVARGSVKARQPFVFMWTNGKCHDELAASFGVGAFQMPTVVVYSPSKARYATNIGVFDEDNTASFLRSVLSGKMGTSPVAQLASFRDEDCPAAGVAVDGVVATEEEDDGDLGDLLSEIIGEEAQQRRAMEQELAAGKPEKSRKKKKGKKSKKKAQKEEL